MAAGLLARRDPCGENIRQATLVDFRGSILSDAGSIPAISTCATVRQHAAGLLCYIFPTITPGDSVKNFLASLSLPAIISLVLVLPFMILELVNRRDFHEGFPLVLFGLLWLLPVLFILTVTPIVRNVRAGNSLLANPISLLLRVAFLALIGWLWAGILIDQMPCFLGVPNCD